MDHVKLLVCPHDTATNPDKWYRFAQFLTRSIEASVQFEKSMDFPEFHKELTTGGLIYANPQDSLVLIKDHDYTPLVRPSNLFDEIVFVANMELENPCLDDLRENNVISVNSMMVTRVGIKYLYEKNIKPASIVSRPSWMAVAKSIFRCEEEYAFLYKDFYLCLNSLSRSGLRNIGETDDGTIHHNILIAPKFLEFAETIMDNLVEMHEQDTRSTGVLTDLGIKQFIPVNKKEIFQFESLGTLGSELM